MLTRLVLDLGSGLGSGLRLGLGLGLGLDTGCDLITDKAAYLSVEAFIQLDI
jgi:hypothetical protein